MTGTQEAILAAVVADPADDLPRLAYADLCEEAGDNARAEFVRAQCAYPEWFDALPGPPGPLPGDVTRAWDLLHDGVADAWLAGLPGAPYGPGLTGTPCWERASWPVGDVLVRFRRGFVTEVTLPCAAWMNHGPALVRAAPLERVTFSDREPYPVDGERRRWFWRMSRLPTVLGPFMPCEDVGPGAPSGWKRYPSRAEAEGALSVAALCWARAAPVAPPPPAG